MYTQVYLNALYIDTLVYNMHIMYVSAVYSLRPFACVCIVQFLSSVVFNKDRYTLDKRQIHVRITAIACVCIVYFLSHLYSDMLLCSVFATLQNAQAKKGVEQIVLFFFDFFEQTYRVGNFVERIGCEKSGKTNFFFKVFLFRFFLNQTYRVGDVVERIGCEKSGVGFVPDNCRGQSVERQHVCHLYRYTLDTRQIQVKRPHVCCHYKSIHVCGCTHMCMCVCISLTTAGLSPIKIHVRYT